MTVHRTQARVDNELIYDRNALQQSQFIGNVAAPTTVILDVGNTVIEAGTVDATTLTIELPNVSLAKGKLYAAKFTLANAGEVHIVPTGTDVGDVVFDDAGVHYVLMYSDGRWWHYLSPGDIEVNMLVTHSKGCTAIVDMSGSVDQYRFIRIDAGTAGVASSMTGNGRADGASYYVQVTPGEPGLYHPIGCQALIELAADVELLAGELVFADDDGKAIPITELPADDGAEPPVPIMYWPLGYVVAKLSVDSDEGSDTHVEVFMFPYSEDGIPGIIDKVQGEKQTGGQT